MDYDGTCTFLTNQLVNESQPIAQPPKSSSKSSVTSKCSRTSLSSAPAAQELVKNEVVSVRL